MVSATILSIALEEHSRVGVREMDAGAEYPGSEVALADGARCLIGFEV